MLFLAKLIWVLAYIGVIHLLTVIFTRFSRSSEIKTQINGSSDSDPSDEYPYNKIHEEIFGSEPLFGSRSWEPQPQLLPLPLSQEENGFITSPVNIVSNNSVPRIIDNNNTSSTSNRYRFSAGNSLSGYIEELPTGSFKVQELFSSDFTQDTPTKKTLASKKFSLPHSQAHHLLDVKGDIDKPKTEEEPKPKPTKPVVVVSREVYPQEVKKEEEKEADNRAEEDAAASCVPDEDFHDHQEPKTEELIASKDTACSSNMDVREVDEISSNSNKDFTINVRGKVEEKISSSNMDVREVYSKAVVSISSLASYPNISTVYHHDNNKGDKKGKSDNHSVSEKIETIESEDDLSDHDFSVSSESDCQEAALENEDDDDDELFSFSPHDLSEKANIISLAEFLNDFEFPDDNTLFHMEEDRELHYSPHSPQAQGTTFNGTDNTKTKRIFMNQEDEENVLSSDSGSDVDGDDSDDDDLERSFVKGNGLATNEEEELEEPQESDIDVLLEHQALVQKMKRELRMSRKNFGLPTILEESPSLKLDEDLKPLKIHDNKVEHKDRIDEIQRFYRSYAEKMRRLDILCHQTMYAVGFMQMKTHNKTHSKRNLSISALESLSGSNCCPQSLKIWKDSDPVHKLYKDLHRDLELVYVGQLCLSWEILKWQHAKSFELQSYDTDGTRRHNQAAEDFQQFHVLVRRFTEDEIFQGPRIHNYIKKRYANRNILQVPQIKDDSKVQRREEGAVLISITKLTDIIEESLYAFWGFLRADKKDECILKIRSLQGVRSHLEDPSDADLLSTLRTELQKKERRLRGLVNSGNCLVRKFQKHQDIRLSHDLLVAQIEVRLISRVLDMSRLTTEQLLWCHKKLNKVCFSGRKVHIESSFMLFPC